MVTDGIAADLPSLQRLRADSGRGAARTARGIVFRLLDQTERRQTMTSRTRRRPDAEPQALQPDPTAPVVYSDRLLRASVVVETAGGLWIVPRTAGGWQRRGRLTMTDAARQDRLRVAGDISPGWLGIPEDGADENECETDAPTNERPMK